MLLTTRRTLALLIASALIPAIVGARIEDNAALAFGDVSGHKYGLADISREKAGQHYVKDALDSIIAGQPIKHSRTLVSGCMIFRDSKEAALAGKTTVTYASQVAKILNENCVVCHRPGEVAPFSLIGFEQA